MLKFINGKIYFHGYDLSGYSNKMELALSAAMLNATVFGCDTEIFGAGLKKLALSGEGFWEAGTAKPDKVIFENIGVADRVCLLSHDGSDNSVAYGLKGIAMTYNFGGQIGIFLPFTFTAEGRGIWTARGKIMAAGAKVETDEGTPRQLGAVGASQKLYGVQQVLAVSGTDTPTITTLIESDDAESFLDPTTRISFAAATAVGAEWATPIDGAIDDDWWRVSWTISGTNPSITIAVLVAIQ